MSGIKIDGYDFFCWNYEGQTKMKHEVLEEYVDNWIQIVGRYHNLNYFDCFGGCGAYSEENNVFYGSPIRIAKAAEKNLYSLNRKVNIIIIEKDKENIENLKKIFEHEKLSVKPFIIEGDFDENINRILDRSNNNLAPTFFFIDPFGFKVKYSTLKRIMSVPKSEIFLNFMFTRINEFLSADKIENTLTELFGCDEWRNFVSLSNNLREQAIVNLFRKQLKKIANYVYYYRMSFPNKNKTYYYLFHLSKHYLGCSIMKSSFAKYNYGKVEYMGPKHGQLTLFDKEDIKIDEVKNFIFLKYSKRKLCFLDIVEENIDEVPYLESELRKAIQCLKKENLVTVIPVDSKTDKGLKGRDVVIFN